VLAHPVLAKGGFVEEPRGDHEAVHREEIVGRQAERAVGGLGYARGHTVTPRTVVRG
jgi:hypothetical protein